MALLLEASLECAAESVCSEHVGPRWRTIYWDVLMMANVAGMEKGRGKTHLAGDQSTTSAGKREDFKVQ